MIDPAPVLKSVGGKTRLLPELLHRLPATFGRYYEPFVGGGALFFALAAQGRLALGATIADINPDIINLYRMLARDVEGVIEHLTEIAARHAEGPLHAYAYFRDRRNSIARSGVVAFAREWAALTLYLNRTCFNGLWRVNKAGDFNVPIGDYENPTIVQTDALRAAAAVLGYDDVAIREVDFRKLFGIETPIAGDVVYCDPPYVPVSATANFVGYTRDGFTLDDQRELARTAVDLAHRGVHVMLSNADTPFTRDLYGHPDLIIDRVEMARAINSNGAKRGKVGEIIVTSRHTHA